MKIEAVWDHALAVAVLSEALSDENPKVASDESHLVQCSRHTVGALYKKWVAFLYEDCKVPRLYFLSKLRI